MRKLWAAISKPLWSGVWCLLVGMWLFCVVGAGRQALTSGDRRWDSAAYGGDGTGGLPNYVPPPLTDAEFSARVGGAKLFGYHRRTGLSLYFEHLKDSQRSGVELSSWFDGFQGRPGEDWCTFGRPDYAPSIKAEVAGCAAAAGRMVEFGGPEVGKYAKLQVSYAYPAVLLSGVLVVLRWARRKRVAAGCCKKCGYDLRGSRSGGCAECGEGMVGGTGE